MIARFELLKLRRSRRPLIAGASLFLFLIMLLLGFYTYAQNETGGQADFRYTFENRSYFNGLTFTIYAFYFGVVLLLPIIVAMEGGSQIAGETSDGTLQLLLARPLSVTRLFFTKIGIAFGFTALTVGVFLIIALTLGLLTVGWGDLNLYPGVLQMTDRPQHLTQDEALRSFLLAWPAATLALSAPLALSFLVSTWVHSPVNAVGISVSLYLILYVISEVHFFLELRPYLFTSYMAFWRELFQSNVHWHALLADGSKLAGFALVFIGLAYRRFRTQEVV